MDKHKASNPKNAPKRRKKATADQLESAWKQYFQNRDQKTLAFLLEEYLPLVDKVANTFLYKKPTVFDMTDLKQAGAMGLLDAIKKFDITKEAKFETYAKIRIKGNILDEINKLDWTPRGVRRNIREIIKANDSFRETEFREPTLSDLADYTQLPKSEIKLAMDQSLRTFILPVEHNSLTDIESGMRTDDVQKNFASLSGTGHNNEFQDVSIAIETHLSDREQTAIRLRFFEEKTLVECSQELNLNIKNFKLLLNQAIEKLQSHFEEE